MSGSPQSPPPPQPPELAARRTRGLRGLLLVLYLLGAAGLLAELVLLEHYEEWQQWLPVGSLIVGLALGVAVQVRPTRPTLQAFAALSGAMVLVGALGVGLHLWGNLEFELELDRELAGMELVWEALRGALPVLAPGALAQLGLMGVLVTWGHPALDPDPTPPPRSA